MGENMKLSSSSRSSPQSQRSRTTMIRLFLILISFSSKPHLACGFLLHPTTKNLAPSRTHQDGTIAQQQQRRILTRIQKITITTTPSSPQRCCLHLSYSPKPIDDVYWPDRFPAKNHCSKCGLCETSFVSKVKDSCAFLNEGMARIDTLEHVIHGRQRNVNDMEWSSSSSSSSSSSTADEARFGVMSNPMKLARGISIPNAQWTGVITGIALSMLQSKTVDAVVCISNKDGDWSQPEPIVARTPEDVMRGRGVKPALAPSLKVLDEIKGDKSIRRLLFCGVGCAVQAFRSIQDDLNLEEVYVLGTNCADNSPTPKAARNFINKGLNIDERKVRGYEFMQDFKVHVKMDSDTSSSSSSYLKKPYFCLPGSVADSAIADSCLACFDYTNGLADVVVGYMAAPLNDNGGMEQSYQSLTTRNERGNLMVQTAINAGRIELHGEVTGSGAHEQISSATVKADSIVMAMTGGEVKQEGMPRWVGEIMAVVMRGIGPKGVNFARYSIDYHVLRNYLHVLDEWGEERVKVALPEYARMIVERYLAEDESFVELRDKILLEKR